MKRTMEFRRHQWFKHRRKAQKVLEQFKDRINPCDMGKAEAVHNCFCSGPCCGNPRKWFGEATVQERRNYMGSNFNDFLKEEGIYEECLEMANETIRNE